MEFCPECGAMLLPKEGKLECSCGYTKNLSDNNEYEVSKEIYAEENVKMLGESNTNNIITIDTSIYKPRRFNKIKK